MNENESKFDLDPARFMIITYDVLFDPRLNEFQKLLFAAITGLEKGKYGYCSASNEFFCQMFNKSQPQVTAAITKLEKLGFIKREMVYKPSSKEIAYRKLTTVMDRKIYDPLEENFSGGIEENLSVINNNIINNISISKDIDEPANGSSLEKNNDNSKEIKIYEVGEVLEDDEASLKPAPREPKGGLQPLMKITREHFDGSAQNEIVIMLDDYLKAHIGCRRLPKPEVWDLRLSELEEFASITLPGAQGKKFMTGRALEIIQRAIIGKDGAPFLEFDNIYNVSIQKQSNVTEPHFNLNQTFKKSY